MKFMHLGDLHIGKELLDFSLIDDQRCILKQILQIIEEQEVQVLLLAGDIYDRADPPERAVSVLNDFLNRLAEMKVDVCMISGNHDSDERLNFGSSLFRHAGIHIKARYDGEMGKETFMDEYGPVNVYMLPFVKASQVRHYYPDEEIRSYEDAVRTVIAKADVDPGERNLILSHQFVTGSSGVKLGGSESPAVQHVGAVEQIGYHCYDAFDYAALGHIHSFQEVGRPEVCYSGSMLKYSLSEADSKKVVPIITLNEKGNMKIEQIPLKPRRDLRKIKGKLKNLIDPANVTDPDDYIYAILTDEDILDNPIGVLQQYYPQTVRVVYEKNLIGDGDSADLEAYTEERPFKDLIADFYNQMYGDDMSDEEMELMLEAAKEAGIEV